MLALATAALAWILVAAQGVPATSPGNVPEPEGLYQGPMHGYTPSTLKGGTVIDPTALAALIKHKRPVLLDVAEAERKPAGMPDGAPWKPRHHSIPGTVWLPGAGQGTLSAAARVAFDRRIVALTAGDKARPIVTYCHPDCWGSWNVAKRLVLAGYREVYWLPAGTEGWQEEHPTQVVVPDPEWTTRPAATGL